MQNIEKLVLNLVEYTTETSWFEFKHNNYEPKQIGESISALANGAALGDHEHAYFIWGINDKTHEIIGTNETQHT